MAFDSTITEQDMDANSKAFVQGQRTEQQDYEPDLSVDGLSESILSRLFSLAGRAIRGKNSRYAACGRRADFRLPAAYRRGSY